jgi:dTDP-4-dehydrorhamnose reductase
MIKTAVIGASGYIGSHLFQRYRKEHQDCIGTSFSSDKPDLIPFDIRKQDIGQLNLEKTGHEAVVISSAKSNISYCENKTLDAFKVNVEGTLNQIKSLSQTSLRIVFLSTDYVFDGIEGNFDDDHQTAPTTIYGKHKKIVEDEIKSLTDDFLVLRLSKIYGQRKGDKTILDEVANLISQDKQVLAAGDQYFCPTYIEDLIDSILNIQKEDLRGYVNVCSPEVWSRYEMHKKLAKVMAKDEILVKKINLYDIPEMRGRPLNTSMICSSLTQKTRTSFIPFEDAIANVANNYKKSNVPTTIG